VKVTAVEIKDVEIPERMQHAMARQAEAERERRAKIINAEGEFQAAARLNDAAEVISRNPVTIQLRYLQTLGEVSNSQSSTIVFPLPIDLIQPLLASAQRSAVPAAATEQASVAESRSGPDAALPAGAGEQATLGAAAAAEQATLGSAAAAEQATPGSAAASAPAGNGSEPLSRRPSTQA